MSAIIVPVETRAQREARRHRELIALPRLHPGRGTRKMGCVDAGAGPFCCVPDEIQQTENARPVEQGLCMPVREEDDWETELTQADATMAHGAPRQTAT